MLKIVTVCDVVAASGLHVNSNRSMKLTKRNKHDSLLFELLSIKVRGCGHMEIINPALHGKKTTAFSKNDLMGSNSNMYLVSSYVQKKTRRFWSTRRREEEESDGHSESQPVTFFRADLDLLRM